ncbi:5-demethoxyubiquinone hydroxylase, mitochondrial-like [Paramacrobiotus metropolitanus]|uniref:5-demethoxyubiquinone hydroxylase, mitochondrial-like n=1 Tax=Paramacrobiotus metropolitanus TaxID=2943436 RepID=UPI0024457D7A|nr:5-demethoxyubiquinone hydroxylase, mitochondrial-like [Paramacrobiotus metropolitanus]
MLIQRLSRAVHTSARNNPLLDRVLRVDHAGEVGADMIYAGQLAVLGRTSVGPVIQEMREQEVHHRETFERLIREHRARPTALLPFWNVAGFVLGAGTALLGPEAAMACTVAVEETIGNHYNNQIRDIMEKYPGQFKDLLMTLKKFRDEELEHLDTGLKHDAELAPAYKTLKNFVQVGCKAAIWISERV